MKYRLQLADGVSYVLSGDDINLQELTEALNSPRKVFLNFGSMILSNTLIDGLLPIIEEGDEDVAK